jgi:hypothetical protein
MRAIRASRGLLLESRAVASERGRPTTTGAALAKPNYDFERRQRELAKKKKQEEKRQKKLAKGSEPAAGDPAPQAPGTDKPA